MFNIFSITGFKWLGSDIFALIINYCLFLLFYPMANSTFLRGEGQTKRTPAVCSGAPAHRGHCTVLSAIWASERAFFQVPPLPCSWVHQCSSMFFRMLFTHPSLFSFCRPAVHQQVLHLQRSPRPALSNRRLPGWVPWPPLPGREGCPVLPPAGTYQQRVQRGEAFRDSSWYESKYLTAFCSAPLMDVL